MSFKGYISDLKTKSSLKHEHRASVPDITFFLAAIHAISEEIVGCKIIHNINPNKFYLVLPNGCAKTMPKAEFVGIDF